MSGAVPPLPHTPSWHVQGQISVYGIMQSDVTVGSKGMCSTSVRWAAEHRAAGCPPAGWTSETTARNLTPSQR